MTLDSVLVRGSSGILFFQEHPAIDRAFRVELEIWQKTDKVGKHFVGKVHQPGPNSFPMEWQSLGLVGRLLLLLTPALE